MTDKLEQTILKILETRRGKHWAISRANLRETVNYVLGTQVSDRRIRHSIGVLRTESRVGSLICSSSRSRGYYMAESYNDVLEMYDQERRRSLTLLQRIRKQRDAARRHFQGQGRMF